MKKFVANLSLLLGVFHSRSAQCTYIPSSETIFSMQDLALIFSGKYNRKIAMAYTNVMLLKPSMQVVFRPKHSVRWFEFDGKKRRISSDMYRNTPTLILVAMYSAKGGNSS